MAGAKQGDTVKVHYVGRLTDGTVFDSSEGREPLEFTLGEGHVVLGFEEAVTGMEMGESKTANIPAFEAFGPFHDEMVQEVDRGQFPDDIAIEAGQQFQFEPPDGPSIVVTVVEADDEIVTVDANHPLAGKDLVFDIELVAIG
jgi:peptidylprolyl isomerase